MCNMRIIKIETGAVVHKTEVGHYNVQYPAGDAVKLNCTVVGEELHWPRQRGLQAVLCENGVVWVDPTDIVKV